MTAPLSLKEQHEREQLISMLETEWKTDEKTIAGVRSLLTRTVSNRPGWFYAFDGTEVSGGEVVRIIQWLETEQRKIEDRLIDLNAPGWVAG